MLSYRIEFSRPGKSPFAVAHHRRGGRYGRDEIAPLGGTLEILAGNLCGSGELTLSRIPERNGYRLSPLDRVQVFFDDDPDPVYLGEVVCDPRPDMNGKVNLKLQSLWERVKMTAWACDTAADGTVQPFKARFRDYLLGVLERAKPDLPPGITIGDIPEVDATLRAVTLHEALGDTVQTALPVTQGGAAGVNAKGQFTIVLPDDQRRHRFIRTQSQRPPGEIGEYRNAIRFAYKKPDGTDAYFVYRYELDIAEHGASWLDDSLPSSVTTTLTNPYAAVSAPINVPMTYPENGQIWTATASLPVMSADWQGKLTLGQDAQHVLSGVEIPYAGEIRLTRTDESVDTRYVLPVSPALPVVARDGNGASISLENTQESGFTDAYPVKTKGTLWLGYDPNALAEYQRNHNAQNPPSFAVMATGTNQADWVVRQPVSINNPSGMELRRVSTYVTTTFLRQSSGAVFIPPDFDTPRTAIISLDNTYQWQAGDTITTNASVDGVTAQTWPTATDFNLNRLADTDDGRRVWRVPNDVRVGKIRVTGNLPDVGWVGINLTDEAGLTAYAIGKLRDLVNPVLSWAGKYNDLRRLDVRGTVGFDDEQGEVDLQVVRGVYDLTALRCTIEAGTKQAMNDTQAIGQAFEGIERIQRLQQRPGGTV